MKTIKDDTLSFLTQTFLYRGSARLSVGVLAGFTLEAKPELLPEQDFLGRIMKGMGKDVVFDPGMPKPFGEVLATGKCYAPGGKPVTATIPALRVGAVRKRLAVFGNRYWKQLSAVKTVISEPEPFVEMDVTWKRAFGGPEYESNPEGMGMAGEPLPVPNVELPDRLIGAPGDRPAPAGFAPRGMSWPGRLKGLGTFDDSWTRNIWPAYPDDYNFLYFNRAPEDQRLEGWFRGDEPVETDHLHPERTYIRSRLPGVRVRCFAVRTENGGEFFAEIEMRLETVWLLPNLLTGVLIWRGVTEVADDEASNTPILSAFTEPLDARPESLEFYLAKVRAMQAGDASFAPAAAPAAEEAAGVGLPDLKAPKIPDIGAAAAAAAAIGAAGASGIATTAMAEEKAGPSEAGISGAVSAAPPDEAAKEAATAAEGKPKPLIVQSVEEIPNVEIPEFPPLEELFGATKLETDAEAELKKAFNIPPGQSLSPEPPPLPDMTPEALQTYMESMAAQADAEGREFMKSHGFDPNAPIEFPPTPPELDRLLQFDPIPETVPPGQLPLLLQNMSRDFQQRFDDLAKKHGIDPNSLTPDEKNPPYSNAAELEQHLRSRGLDSPDLFEELRKIDALQKEAEFRMDQYLAVVGTSRAALAANAVQEAGALRNQEEAEQAELREFMTQLAAGAVPGMEGGVPRSMPDAPSPSGAENAAMPEDDGFEDDLPEEGPPPPEPPAREDVLNRLAGGESLAGASLAGANLSGADLSNRDFRRTDFSGANLEKADFTNSDLTGANFSGAILTGAIFTGAILTGANLSGASAAGANLSGIGLEKADLSGGDFTGADFSRSNLSEARLEKTVFNEAKMAGITAGNAAAPRAEFMGADLSGADFSGADLSKADFTGATVEKANFTGAIAESAWFSGVRGRGAVFRGANLLNSRAHSNADLAGTDFSGTSFRDARWQDADLSGTRFAGAGMENALFTRCRFEDADLSGVNAPNADFQKSVLIRTKAGRLNLFKGSLRKVKLIEADFSGANLYGVDFFGAAVTHTRFEGADLENTLLSGWRPPA